MPQKMRLKLKNPCKNELEAIDLAISVDELVS